MIPEDLMAAYLATDIDVWTPERIRVAGRGAVVDLPWSSIGVITAWNPWSRLTPSDNEHRNAHLAHLLRTAGVEMMPARGAGGDWFERSFAVPDPEVDLLLDLGRQFDQHGVYLVSPDLLTVIDCADGSRTTGPRIAPDDVTIDVHQGNP